VNIRRYDVHQLRKQFGIVLQDPFLFTGTLESNVRLGNEEITRAQVESALREVGLGSLLDGLQDGVETNVSERGATFSVGQRQLVSFARALAHNPRFRFTPDGCRHPHHRRRCFGARRYRGKTI
jgi:ATP-binding cassette subfamily B multidrug efflux pump